MLLKSKFLSTLDDFIDRAGEISKLCSDMSVKRSINPFLSSDIHKQYTVWKLEFYSILQQQKLTTDAKLFHIENKVHLLNGVVEFKDKDVPDSRGLIKDISSELDEKLKHIREIYQREKGKSVTVSKFSNNKFTFLFNRNTGELSRYPKQPLGCLIFSMKKGRGRVLEFLIEEKDNGDHYVSTVELTKIGGYKNRQKCREGIHEIRHKVEETFKNLNGNDFIETQQADGYRIGSKVSISFEGTP